MSIALMEKYTLKVLNAVEVLRKILAPLRKEMIGGWRNFKV